VHFDARKRKSLTAKDTKEHEGLQFLWVPSCDFVSVVVKNPQNPATTQV
jgi:hypothetical protein